jgi:hypothetical protein
VILLYVDVLGMKGRWRAGGPDAARAAHHTLDLVIRHALEAVPFAEAVEGGVQSDAAALIFREARQAVEVGRLIFREAFRRSGSSENGGERFWIRGVIRQMATSSLESTDALAGAASGVSKRIFSEDLMDAIHVEQSGYKGQRLLIQESLIDPDVTDAFKIPIRGGVFHPLATLQYVPAVVGYRDVLWMFPPSGGDETDSEWHLMKVAMQNRLRWSSNGGDEEFVQAAATQVLFAGCETVYVHLIENASGSA